MAPNCCSRKHSRKANDIKLHVCQRKTQRFIISLYLSTRRCKNVSSEKTRPQKHCVSPPGQPPPNHLISVTFLPASEKSGRSIYFAHLYRLIHIFRAFIDVAAVRGRHKVRQKKNKRRRDQAPQSGGLAKTPGATEADNDFVIQAKKMWHERPCALGARAWAKVGDRNNKGEP